MKIQAVLVVDKGLDLEGQIFPPRTKMFSGLKLSNCIGQDNEKVFSILRLSKDFLYLPVHEWSVSLLFQDGLKIINSLKCVNDCAERARS